MKTDVVYVCPKCGVNVTNETFSHECLVSFVIKGVATEVIATTVYRPRVSKTKQNSVEGYMKWAGSRPNQVAK